MIDVIGAIVLTALAITAPGILLMTSPVSPSAARRLASAVGAWPVILTHLAIFARLGQRDRKGALRRRFAG